MMSLSSAFRGFHASRLLAVATVALFLFAAPSTQAQPPSGRASRDDSQGLTRVTFMPQWSPQSQFAGFYVARAKGIYRRAGLDVELLAGGPSGHPLEALKKGEADFATTFLADAIAELDKGTSIVHLAQVVNRCTLLLVAWSDENIRTIADLDGRRISLWEGGFRIPFLALFRAQGVEPIIVPQYTSVSLFLRRGVAACSALNYNEYHAIYQAGVDPEQMHTFVIQDYGFGFPEDGIYCMAKTLRERPEVSRAFARASLEGWAYAERHRAEALDIVMREVREIGVASNEPHMRWMLDRIVPSIVPGPSADWELGRLDRDSYLRAATLLRDYDMITSIPSFDEFLGRAPGHASPVGQSP